MNKKENLNNLSPNKEQQLKQIGQTNFRELFNEIVFIKPKEALLNSLIKNHGDNQTDYNGFLAYGYIDEQAGFTFRILCLAKLEDKTIFRARFIANDHIIIRKGQLNDCYYLNLENYGVETSDFKEAIEDIYNHYKCENKQTEEMRNFTFLDEVRHIDYPDDIQIVLYEKDMEPEKVWVKCFSFTKNKLFGKLLNEPYQDFGIHQGDIIRFIPYNLENGNIFIYYGKWLEEAE